MKKFENGAASTLGTEAWQRLGRFDADVLINAVRGNSVLTVAARAIINDPGREFIATDILRLELLPKTRFFRRAAEERFTSVFCSGC